MGVLYLLSGKSTESKNKRARNSMKLLIQERTLMTRWLKLTVSWILISGGKITEVKAKHRESDLPR